LDHRHTQSIKRISNALNKFLVNLFLLKLFIVTSEPWVPSTPSDQDLALFRSLFPTSSSGSLIRSVSRNGNGNGVRSNGIIVEEEKKEEPPEHLEVLVTEEGLAVDGVIYKPVRSLVALLQAIHDLFHITSSFPPIAPESTQKLVSFLRVYDSSSRDLVLQAGAIKSNARLKSISAKHLCHSLLSISLLCALVPLIQEKWRSLLPAKQAIRLVEVDRVLGEVVEHRTDLLLKFSGIISDMLDVFSGPPLEEFDWDSSQLQNGQNGESSSSHHCQYFTMAIKNVTSLHKVLFQLLPPPQAQEAIEHVFYVLSRKVPDHFKAISPSTDTGKQRFLVLHSKSLISHIIRIIDEIVHLEGSLTTLRGIDSHICNILNLENTFKEKFGT